MVLLTAGALPAQASTAVGLTGSHSSVSPLGSLLLDREPSLSWSNPALLATSGDSFAFSFFLLGLDLDIELAARPSGADISSAIYRARMLMADGTTVRLSHRPLATAELRHGRGSLDPDMVVPYLGMGMISQIIPGRLALGFHALVPARDFQSQGTFFADEREQYFSNSLQFELLGDRLRNNRLTLALGGLPWSWLQVGVGVTMETGTRVRSELYVGDAAYQENALFNSHMEVDIGLSPHGSVVVEPLEGLRLMTSLHLPVESVIDGGSDLQMWSYPYPEGKESLVQHFDFSQGMEPLRVEVGASWEGTAGALSYGVAAVGNWSRWSTYRDRHGEQPVRGWSDTLSGTVAGRLALGAGTVGGELSFVPSPVPDQAGRSNYVDNDRLGAALGWSWSFDLGERQWQAGLQAQFHRLLLREAVKDPAAADALFDEFPDSVDLQTGLAIPESAGLQSNNPGYPGWSSSGWGYGGGLFLRSSY